MKSVTDQILGDGALQGAIDDGMVKPNEDLVRAEPADSQHARQTKAEAALRVAYAMRSKHGAAKATGVKLVSAGHNQVQEIFDDGSVRNPYKVNRKLSGRQRKRMRRAANHAMRSRGIKADIADVLKGRRVGTPERPQSETMSPSPAANNGQGLDAVVGTPVAAILGD